MHYLHRARIYLHHWLHAVNHHSLHEPFVYDLYVNALAPHLRIPDPAIENRRAEYANRKEPLQLESIGAASTFATRSLQQIAFSGSTEPTHAALLRNLLAYSGGRTVLELGTSLGFTTRYLASVPDTTVYTLEGESLLCAEAQKQFEGRENIHLIRGNIDETLHEALRLQPSIDFLYMDANHRYAPTVSYLEKCLPHCHDSSIIVIDDIHWSDEMSAAWKHVCNREEIRLAIDLFHMGIVFPRPMKQKYFYILH